VQRCFHHSLFTQCHFNITSRLQQCSHHTLLTQCEGLIKFDGCLDAAVMIRSGDILNSVHTSSHSHPYPASVMYYLHSFYICCFQ
jgi:hypothetical protein